MADKKTKGIKKSKKTKKEGISWIFILFFFSLLGFFAYMIVEHGEIAVQPLLKIGNELKEYSEYWNWMIYKVHGNNQYYIDLTYFISVFSFFIGIIYLFANVRDGDFSRYYSSRAHITEDVLFWILFIVLKLFLASLPYYRLYMVLILPIFLNLYVMKYVGYSKGHRI